MAQNPYVNKVIYGNQTVMDISDSTAEAADVAAGEVFYKADGSRTVGTYVPITPASVTPSNVSPAALTANTPVTPTANGYAIESYASVTPSSAGTYFQSGICNMTTSGYAYDSQQGGTETTLWENPSPRSYFSAQTVTLSDSYSNYNKIAFYYKPNNFGSTILMVAYDKATMDKLHIGNSGVFVAMLSAFQDSTYIARAIEGSSDGNQITFLDCVKIMSGTVYSSGLVPTKITGIS